MIYRFPDSMPGKKYFECNTPQKLKQNVYRHYRLTPLLCTIVWTKRLNSNHIVTKSELPRGNPKLYGYSILIPFSIIWHIREILARLRHRASYVTFPNYGLQIKSIKSIFSHSLPCLDQGNQNICIMFTRIKNIF